MLDVGQVDTRHVLGPKEITDVYLFALAVRNGGRLVTTNPIPIAPVTGANTAHFVVL